MANAVGFKAKAKIVVLRPRPNIHGSCHWPSFVRSRLDYCNSLYDKSRVLLISHVPDIGQRSKAICTHRGRRGLPLEADIYCKQPSAYSKLSCFSCLCYCWSFQTQPWPHSEISALARSETHQIQSFLPRFTTTIPSKSRLGRFWRSFIWFSLWWYDYADLLWLMIMLICLTESEIDCFIEHLCSAYRFYSFIFFFFFICVPYSCTIFMLNKAQPLTQEVKVIFPPINMSLLPKILVDLTWLDLGQTVI